VFSLAEIVSELAQALTRADGKLPVARSQRGNRVYRPGIGPHGEDAAILLALAELPQSEGPWLQFVPYPGLLRQKCDLGIGQPLEWAVEIKMARLRGDNGQPDDTALKDILSPYASDRSALTDCVKLAASSFPCGKAVIVYGFDFPNRPLDPVIDAFQVLAARLVELGPRQVAAMGSLVHPVHAAGRVFGWEVAPKVRGVV